MVKTLETTLETLKREHIARVPFPFPRRELVLLRERYLDFLEQPEAVKLQFHERPHPYDPRSTIGYAERKIKDGRLDNKEIFHYNPLAEEFFRDAIRNANAPTRAYLEQARLTYAVAREMLLDVLAPWEREFTGIMKRYTAQPERFYLRSLAYVDVGKGGVVAKEHCDLGALTFQLDESHPGFLAGEKDREKEVVHEDGWATVFAGKSIDQTTGPGVLVPLRHLVRQKDQTPLRVGPRHTYSRASFIFFADPIDQVSASEKEAHTFGPQ